MNDSSVASSLHLWVWQWSVHFRATRAATRRAGATLDACYRTACADAFAQLPAVVGSTDRELRAFHLDDRGSVHEQRLILAHPVLSPDLYAMMAARARDLHTSPDALCRDLCLGVLQAKTGVAHTLR